MSRIRAVIEMADFYHVVEKASRTASFYAPTVRRNSAGRQESEAAQSPHPEDQTSGNAPFTNDVRFELLDAEAGNPIIFNYKNTVRPPKEIFFPQREVLLSFQSDSLRAVPLSHEKIIIFGIRPCDARSLTCLDKIFCDGRYQDPYYLFRRENSLIISLACDEPEATCFCTSMGGSPAGKEGADILAFRMEEKLLFEAVTERGTEFINEHDASFRPAGAHDDAAVEARVGAAEDLLRDIDLNGLKQKLDRDFEHPIWEELSRRCWGCGVCSYLCPTCHCFDINDEVDGRSFGVRIRTWDSCQYPNFTLHASGHNPRGDTRQRLRQRIMHKFSYTVESHGLAFCVGCGRCVRNCPVNLDLREMLVSLAGL